MKKAMALLCLCVLLLHVLPAAADPAPVEAAKRTVSGEPLNTTLAGAFRRCAELAGVPVLPDWTALRATGVTPDSRVALNVPAGTVGGLLDRLLAAVQKEASPLAWYADTKAIRVTTRMELLQNLKVAREAIARHAAARAKEPRKLEFEEIPFADVVDFFRNATGINFHVNWRALALVGVSRETPVTLKATNITVARALDLVCDQLVAAQDKLGRVYWVVDEGMVKIATGEALNQSLQTRVYDVTHLLFVVPNFKGPRMLLSPTERNKDTTNQTNVNIWDQANDTNQNSGAEEEESVAEQRKKLRENLVEIVKDAIGKDMWAEGGGKGSVRIHRGKLVVTQTLLGFKLFERSFKLQ